MVRFQWYTDEGSVGQVLPGNFTQDATAKVYYVTAEIKISGQRATVEAHFTLPEKFLTETEAVGVALPVGERAAQWNLKFLTELGTSLAKQGHVVVRYLARFDEQRKHMEIQKTIGACLASPYCQFVEKWVLLGAGNSSHIACSVSPFFAGVLGAMIFAASPLTLKHVADPEITLRSPEISEEVPLLFLHPSVAEACSADELLDRLKQPSSKGIKYMTIPDVDQNLRTSKGKNAAHLVSSFVISAVLEFLNALKSDRLEDCLMPSLDRLSESEGVPDTAQTPTEDKPEDIEMLDKPQ